MINLLISFFLFFFITSCKINETNKILKSSNNKIINFEKNISKESENLFPNQKINKDNLVMYIIGNPYFIEGVHYTPEENYSYNEVGLASFYGKELHNKKTINNDFNKVTELFARHNTLPIPSIVKITNIENGLSLTLKVNDRHFENSSIIQVSRKAAQLLRFYKNKIARVKVEVLPDPSKQMKIVTQSISNDKFSETVDSAPTELVSIIDLDNNNSNTESLLIEQPIEIGFETIKNKDLYLKIKDFKSFKESKLTINKLKISYKFIVEAESDGTFNLIIGPLNNKDANNLVLSFISKGYKNNEFIIK